MASFHTFADGTVIRLDYVDMVGPVVSGAEYYGDMATDGDTTSYVYRVVSLGFAGGMAVFKHPSVRSNIDRAALEAERTALIQALNSLP